MAVGRVSAHKIGDESYNSIAGGGGQQERNSADIKIHRTVFICKSVRFEHQPYGERDSRKGEVCHKKAAAEVFFVKSKGEKIKKPCTFESTGLKNIFSSGCLLPRVL